MTASCSSLVRAQEHFWVKYTLQNNLQDFLAVHLIWNTKGELEMPLATEHFFLFVCLKTLLSSYVV